ncbi:beta-galactosidase-1-like protein 2 [Equus quagga]|uniref:beta-galactosidase-1-like protein 2 n=1 Tax=Equus quagga TaxID=89248 RepID=UPI001EE39945|nr:beta-galactosidase-1-like protein 2 [Equus quagga]
MTYKNGGPIIAVQVENEYGSYHLDKRYMLYIKKALVKRGVDVLLMTADDGQGLIRGHLEKVIATVHMKNIKKETYEKLSSIQGRSPILMMVYTANSLDGWGTLRHTLDANVLMKDVREMFNLRFSLNFYMFHGGTNFGFMGGAASLQNYLPMVTSYGKPLLLEIHCKTHYFGSLTSIREAMLCGWALHSLWLWDSRVHCVLEWGWERTLEWPNLLFFIAEIPKLSREDARPKAVYKSVITAYYMSLWDILTYLDEPVRSAKPICMEKLSVNQGSGQSYGYILYETVITTGGLLASRGHVQDRGQVFLEEKYIGILDHSTNQLTIPKEKGQKDYLTLRILVENQGRLAYGQDINKERKGLTGDIYLNNSPLRNFKIYSLEMNPKFLKRGLPKIWKPVIHKLQGPAFFLGILRVGNYPKDTFIKLEDWTKGVIFINGQNLGRYWNIGPQETFYLPGPWLQPGSNEIIVFEEFKSGTKIQFTNMSHLGTVFWRVICSIWDNSVVLSSCDREKEGGTCTISQEPEPFLTALA